MTGIKVIFRVGLGIMDLIQSHLLKHCPTSTELMEFMLHIPHDMLGPDQLIKAALKVNLGTTEIEKLEERATRVWREQQQKATAR